MRSYAHLTAHITGQRGQQRDWYLIQMMPEEGRVFVRGYPLDQFVVAKDELSRAEEKFHNTRNQAVLVAAASINELKRAYPNYFADTTLFTSVLTKFLKI